MPMYFGLRRRSFVQQAMMMSDWLSPYPPHIAEPLNKPFTAFHLFSVQFSWTNGKSYIIFELSDNLKIYVL